MTKFSEWAEDQRKKHERGDISSTAYAQNLDRKARESGLDPKDASWLKSRARFIRNDAENKKRALRQQQERNKKRPF